MKTSILYSHTSSKIVAFSILLILVTGVSGQSPQLDDVRKELVKVNELSVSNFRLGNLKEATKYAENAVELSMQLFGQNSTETAVALYNLGEIQKANDRLTPSIENLMKAAAILIIQENPNYDRISKITRSLVFAMQKKGQVNEAVKLLLDDLKRREAAFGIQSILLTPALSNLAVFYAEAKMFTDADKTYTRWYLLFPKYEDRRRTEFEKLADEHVCYETQNYEVKDQRKRRDALKTSIPWMADENSYEYTIINYRAISMPRPNYPPGVFRPASMGDVIIKVRVDASGDVTEAIPLCGFPAFAQFAKTAAINSRFEVSKRNGNPIEITGYLYYLFAR